MLPTVTANDMEVYCCNSHFAISTYPEDMRALLQNYRRQYSKKAASEAAVSCPLSAVPAFNIYYIYPEHRTVNHPFGLGKGAGPIQREQRSLTRGQASRITSVYGFILKIMPVTMCNTGQR